ncbi:MAG: DUF4062 domain-containing protein [Planctomycetota bacterium]
MAGIRVFISSTGDLRKHRDITARVVRSLGFDPRWLDLAATESGDLLAVLRKWVKQCDTVVQLVGRRYGTEPPVPIGEKDLPGGLPEGMTRCSYTQYEALYAEAIGKPVRYIWLDDALDSEAAKEQDPADGAMQGVYRDDLVRRNVVRHEVENEDALENRVLKMREWLEEVQSQSRRRFRWAMALAGVGVLVGTVALVMLWRQSRAISELDLAATLPSPVERMLEEAGVSQDDVTLDYFAFNLRSGSLMGNGGAGVQVEPTNTLASPFVDNGMLELSVGKDGPWNMVLESSNLFGGGYYVLLTAADLERGGTLWARVDSVGGPGVGDTLGPWDTGQDVNQEAKKRLRSDLGAAGPKWLFKSEIGWKIDTRFMVERNGQLSTLVIGPSPEALTLRYDFPPPISPDLSQKQQIQQTVTNNMPLATLQQSLTPFNHLDTLYARLTLTDGTEGEVREFGR